MSMISEQVKELRKYADKYKTSQEAVFGTIKVLNQAADTIESLSAKLEETKWTPCSNRLPKEPPQIPLTTEEPEQMIEDDILQECIVTIYGAKKSTMLYYAGNGEWCDPVTAEFYDVIAWQPLPEPYKPNNQAAVQKGDNQ